MQLEEVTKQVALDPKLSQIRTALGREHLITPSHSLTQGILYYHNKLVLTAKFNLIQLILHDCHDSPVGGHSGVLKTLKRVVAPLYLRGMKGDIQAYIAAYPIFQQNKYSTISPNGFLQPLPIPNQICEDISLVGTQFLL